jgi:hypothetical protein
MSNLTKEQIDNLKKNIFKILKLKNIIVDDTILFEIKEKEKKKNQVILTKRGAQAYRYFDKHEDITICHADFPEEYKIYRTLVETFENIEIKQKLKIGKQHENMLKQKLKDQNKKYLDEIVEWY